MRYRCFYLYVSLQHSIFTSIYSGFFSKQATLAKDKFSNCNNHLVFNCYHKLTNVWRDGERIDLGDPDNHFDTVCFLWRPDNQRRLRLPVSCVFFFVCLMYLFICATNSIQSSVHSSLCPQFFFFVVRNVFAQLSISSAQHICAISFAQCTRFYRTLHLFNFPSLCAIHLRKFRSFVRTLNVRNALSCSVLRH